MRKIGTSLLIIGIVLVSCHKTDSVIKNKLNLKPSMTVDAPTVTNGMLDFADEEHLRDYLDYLGSTLAFDSTDSVGMRDPDSILAIIENNYSGFSSLRAQAKTDFEVLNETGWDNLDDIPDIHFVKDILMRSVLNTNLDVKVGDQILHYINREYNVTLPASNTDLLDAYHNLTEAATLQDIIDLTHGVDAFVCGNYSANVKTTSANRPTSDDYDIPIPLREYPDQCNHPKKIVLQAITMFNSENGAKQYGDYTIDWGDGSSQFHYSTTFGSPDFDVYHEYANFGTYQVKIYGKSQGPDVSWNTIDAETDMHFTIDNQCTFGEIYKESLNIEYLYDNNNRAFKGQCWVTQGSNMFNTAYNRIRAETNCYRKQNGKWKHKDGDSPSAETWCDIYKNDCSLDYHGYHGTSVYGSAKSAFSDHGIGHRFGWNSVFAKYSVKFNGQTYFFTFGLTPCN